MAKNPPKDNEVTTELKSTLELRKANEQDEPRLKLKDTRGKNILLTIEQALKPHNFRQLSETSQNVVLNGKSAYQKLKEEGHI